MINRFIEWGKRCNNLYAAFLVGFHARKFHGADEFSDVDVAVNFIFHSQKPAFLRAAKLGAFFLTML